MVTANTCSDGTWATGTGALTSGSTTACTVFAGSSGTFATNTNTGWLSRPVGRLRYAMVTAMSGLAPPPNQSGAEMVNCCVLPSEYTT